MKNKQIDAPVYLIFFIRPHTLSVVFKEIKKAKPTRLFLVSDAPRSHIKSDKDLNDMCKNIVEDIDWECEVHKFYAENNQGMYKMFYESLQWAFVKTDRLIIFEDDVVPNQSFFNYCDEMLERYKDDERIQMICGMNHLGVYDRVNSDYFFSKAGSIWGFAIWKRTFDSFDFEMRYSDDEYTLRTLDDIIPKFRKHLIQNAKLYQEDELSIDKRIAYEFQCGLSLYLQNRLYIVPKRNMIHCIGATEGASHAENNIKKMPKAIQKIFEMETYEISGVIQHPRFIIQDDYYEKKVNRIMGNGHLIVRIYRRIESIIRRIIY